MAERWSPDHLRLHRWLRQRPELLPPQATLLLAVSGGQDSMAMTELLRDLTRLYGWRLQLWHGDHRWRTDSGRQAEELVDWAQGQGLAITLDSWQVPQVGEAAARTWRYARLTERARQLGASRVVSGHTGSDRAETLLLQLARGSHRRGLAGPQALRPLTHGIQLARPLLAFSRGDTARLCRELRLPIWPDPSNQDPAFARNRIRQEVLPVLEALHPGSAQRLCALSERLSEEEQALAELAERALPSLLLPQAAGAASLDRRSLMALQPANQRRLLQGWLSQEGVSPLPSRQLEDLLTRLRPGRGAGRRALAAGRTLHWDRQRLWLAEAGHLP